MKVQEENLAIAAAMNGDYKTAIMILDELSGNKTQEHPHKLLRTNFYLLLGREIERDISTLENEREERVTPQETSLLKCAQGLLAFSEGNEQQAELLLREAIHQDTENDLARLALSRYYIFATKNFKRAKEIIENTIQRHPEALGIIKTKISLEAESGNYKEAARIGWLALRIKPTSISLWMSAITAFLASTPFSGRTSIILAVLLAFVPYVGPGVLVTAIILCAFGFIFLRRISYQLIAFLVISMIPISAAYLLRWLLLGQFFP